MDYELYLELKNAGFPLKRIQRNDTHGHYWREVFTTPDDKSYLVPTLEELIKACERPIWIESSPVEGAEWMAGRGKGMNTPLGMGRTPTEAVVRLWLALNKKES